MADAVVGFARIVVGVDESPLKSGFASAGQSAEKFKAALKANLNDVERAMAAPTLAVKRLEASLRGDSLLKSANNLTAATQRIGGAAKLTEAEAARLNVTLTKAIEKYKALGQEAPKALQELERATRKTETAMSSLGTMAKTAVGSFVGFMGAQAAMSGLRAGFGLVKTAVLDTNAAIETSTLQFTTLIGSADEARAHVRDLFEFAKDTPFLGAEVVQASRMLRTFGGSVLDTKANLALLGDASAATSAPLQDLGFWVGRLYSNIASGKPFGEAAMRLQELAVMSPQARAAMEGLQKSGADASRVFGVFQQDLTKFTGSMELQASTWKGVVSTLEDSVNLLLADTLKPFFETFRDGIKLVNRAMASDEVARAADQFKAAVQGAFGKDSQTQVQTLANAMITFADATLTAAEITYRGFHVVRDGVAGIVGTVLSGISKVYDAGTKLTEWLAQAGKVPGSPFGVLFTDKEVERTRVNAAMLRTMADEFLHASDASEAAWRGQDAFVKGLGGMRDVLGAARQNLATAADATTKVGDTSRTAAGGVNTFGVALGDAATAAEKYMTRIGALRDDVTGQADINSAKEWVDALRGVDLSQIEPAKLGRINDELLKGIEAYRRQLKAIPGDMRAAFEATRSSAMSWMDQSRDDMLFRIGRDQILDEIALKAPDAKPDLWSWMDQDRDDSKFFSEVDLILDDILLKGQKLEGVRWPDLWTQSITDLVGVLDQAAARTDSLSVRAARSVALLAQAITSQHGVGIEGLRWLGASDVNENGRIRKVSLSERFAGGAMLASGFASLAGAGERMTAATSQGDSRAGRAISGAGEAAQIGMAFGPQAAAVAAAWGALVGALNNPADQARQSANKFLQGLSDSFDEVATSAQQAEAASESLKAKISGGQSAPSIRSWILIRDAYLDTGQTVERAKKDFEELKEAAERGPEAVARALAKINLQLERQTQLLDARVKKQDLLNQAVQRWGLSFQEAGQGFQRGQLAEQAEQMIEDFDLLTESGANPETVAARMAKAMSEFVQQARLTGTQVPEAMRPIVESLLRQGLLLDENGLAFQNMKSTGITFGQALESLFENVLLKLERLITALTAPLPDTPAAHTPSPLGEYTGQGAKPRTMHEGGIVRAHSGMFVGGRLGAGEVPIVAQSGEAVMSRLATSLMGGKRTVDALNRGNVPAAMASMSSRWAMPQFTMPMIPQIDPMAGMGAAIDSVSRPMLSSASAVVSRGGAIAANAGGTVVNLTIERGAVQVTSSGNAGADGDAILDRVIQGLHSNRNGFRTKVIQKTVKGQ